MAHKCHTIFFVRNYNKTKGVKAMIKYVNMLVELGFTLITADEIVKDFLNDNDETGLKKYIERVEVSKMEITTI